MGRRGEAGHARAVSGPIALEIQPTVVVRATTKTVVVRKSILERYFTQKAVCSALSRARFAQLRSFGRASLTRNARPPISLPLSWAIAASPSL